LQKELEKREAQLAGLDQREQALAEREATLGERLRERETEVTTRGEAELDRRAEAVAERETTAAARVRAADAREERDPAPRFETTGGGAAARRARRPG